MAKVKFDTKKLQQFVLEKGERVGLTAAMVVMGFFLGYGVYTGLRATSPEDTIKKATDQLAGRIETARPTEEEKKKADPKQFAPIGDWYKLDRLDTYASAGAWFDPGAAGDSKRRNPGVLPVGDVVAGKVANIQMNGLAGGAVLLEYDAKRGTLATLKPAPASGGGAFPVAPAPAAPAGSAQDDNYVHNLHPTHMVVVSATFPYRDQLEVIRKALRLASVNDLVGAQADPHFLGLNVYRWEVLADGKATDPKPLYEYDPAKNQTVVHMPETELLLTTAVYDEANASLLAEYILTGLVTPLPKLENARYPPLALAGITAKEGDETDKTNPAVPPPATKTPLLPTGNPLFPGGRGPGPVAPGTGVPTVNEAMMTAGTPMLLSKLPDSQKPLQEKLKGNIDFFDPSGRPLEDKDDGKGGTSGAPRTPMPPPQGAGNTGATPPTPGDKAPTKILVRFFDADVQPGKTYQYSIQVRMANPNFGKTKDVAFLALAEQKELVSPFTVTPAISIGTEFFTYAVDVNPRELATKATGSKGSEKDAATADKTAIQVHRWVGKVLEGGQDRVVADWVIAERLLIHRGEILGRTQVEVELPVWNKYRGQHGQFELAVIGGSSRGKVGKAFRQAAPVDFLPGDRPPSILVDFEGGKRPYPSPTGGSINDEASTELLVLNPDGKLVVQTSRDDSDLDNPAGRERADRYHAWRKHINRFRPATQGPGGMMPSGAGPGG